MSGQQRTGLLAKSLYRRIWFRVVAVLVVLVIAIILLWDWDWFKPMVEAQASSALGRKVTLQSAADGTIQASEILEPKK